MSETAGGKVAVQLLNISQYSYEEIYSKLDQTANPAYLLVEISGNCSKDLAMSMTMQGYHYELDMMTGLFGAELSSNASSMCTLFDETES